MDFGGLLEYLAPLAFILIALFNSFLRKRIQGKITPVYTNRRDLQFCNKNKKYFKRKIFLHKLKINDKDLKKIVLIAPHAFTDAPHSRGNVFIFRDYYFLGIV